MGVKDLWSILSPVSKHRKLEDLRGQKLAVDLSIWICEVKSMKQLQGVVKPHLRNLFFRICHLLQLGIQLVFVVEGTPPALKWDTICKRLDSGASRKVQGSKSTVHRQTSKMSRSHFKSIIKECCVMLEYIGVPVVQSEGEAEAMCALLNAKQMVDACITNDGDAFLYGATVVYRNFTINTKDPHVESYSMDDIESRLLLSREKLVALSLLLGCDYVPRGVPGVGKETAMRYMATVPGRFPVLTRFEEWTGKKPASDLLSHPAPVHCAECGHVGETQQHAFKGCPSCEMMICMASNKNNPCQCEWHTNYIKGVEMEQTIRKKALTLKGFPDKEVIKEFLESRDKLPRGPLIWKRPRIFALQKFHTDTLEWAEEYSFDKVLPLLTLHDLTQIRDKGMDNLRVYLRPLSIVKARVRQGIPCFEVNWQKMDEDDISQADHYTTIEEKELFRLCFPNVVDNFEETLISSKSRKKSETRKSKKTISRAPGNDLESKPTNENIPFKNNVSLSNLQPPDDVSWFTSSTNRLTASIPFSKAPVTSPREGNVKPQKLQSDKPSLRSTHEQHAANDRWSPVGQAGKQVRQAKREISGTHNPTSITTIAEAVPFTELTTNIQAPSSISWFSNSPRGVSGFVPADVMMRPKLPRVKTKKKKPLSKLARRAEAVLEDLHSPLVGQSDTKIPRQRKATMYDVDKLSSVVSKLNLNSEGCEDVQVHAHPGCQEPISNNTLHPENEAVLSLDKCLSSTNNNVMKPYVSTGPIVDMKENKDPCVSSDTDHAYDISPGCKLTWNASQFGQFEANFSLLSNMSGTGSPPPFTERQLLSSPPRYVLQTLPISDPRDEPTPHQHRSVDSETSNTCSDAHCESTLHTEQTGSSDTSSDEDMLVLSQIPLAQRLAMKGNYFHEADSARQDTSERYDSTKPMRTLSGDADNDSILLVDE